LKYISANWPAPKHIKALTTTRAGGVSEGVFAGLNLGDHVGDDSEKVQRNRKILTSELGLQLNPQWLSQVHGTDVIEASAAGNVVEADACWTAESGLACVVMTADCLPVFFTDFQGEKVAVAHAGWRGLVDGVLENTLRRFAKPEEVHVWMGPAIGLQAFEVGAEVKAQFQASQPEAVTAFEPVSGKDGKYLANIYRLAELRLKQAGVKSINSCDLCTFGDSDSFYSYRRDGQTGRLASLIWIDAKAAKV
jgi:YfiH family protein